MSRPSPFPKRTDAGWEGFEYGVMTAIAAEIGVPVTIVEVSVSALDDMARDGRADLAIGQLSPAAAHPPLGRGPRARRRSALDRAPRGQPRRRGRRPDRLYAGLRLRVPAGR